MVKSFEEWKESCSKEHGKLADVSVYLNSDGNERLLVYGVMLNLACYCETAEELIKWIHKKENLEKEELKLLESPHARAPIASLRRIVEMESASAEDEHKPTFYVTYRIDARYIAAVTANDVEEARRLAQYEWEEADFGVAEDIEGDQVSVENEKGDIVWEY